MIKNCSASALYRFALISLCLGTAVTPLAAQGGPEIVLRVLHGSHIGGPGWYGIYDQDRANVYATHGSQNYNEYLAWWIPEGGTATAYGFTFRRVEIYTYSEDNSGLPGHETISLYQDDPTPSPTPSTNLTDNDEKEGGDTCGEGAGASSMSPMARYSVHSRR